MKTLLESSPILPVIVIEDATRAVPLAEALLAGGLGAIEVTFRSAAAADAIRAIRSQLPQMIVSAGTVISVEQAKRAIDAGAQFGLSPGCDPEVIHYFREHGLSFVPGVMTPTDIQMALKAGCTHMKFFPAEAAGGVNLLKALAAPFKSQGIRFCPTGGLSLKNMADYLALPEVFAIGGTWLATAQHIAQCDWAGITANVKAALAAAIRKS